MAARIGGRIRRGTSGTVVAAAVMVALTASQAPGVDVLRSGADNTGRTIPDGDPPADGGSPYHTELPPLDSPDEKGEPGGAEPDRKGRAEAGIPATVLAAYKRAERTLGQEKPGCNLPWELLAAIGKVESGQARGGALDAAGNTLKAIRGPALDGNGFALIKDTDGGEFDGDTTHDRAVGPMQFIPSTWAKWRADGNGDGVEDPNNVYDASLAAGRYLCAAGRDLSRQADLERAILSYNRSRDYLRTVLSWLEFYRKGTHEVPDGSGSLPDSPGAGNPSKPATKPAKPANDTSSTSKPQSKPKPTTPSNSGGKPGSGGSKNPTPSPGGSTPSGGGSQSPSPRPTDPTPTPPDPTPAPATELKRASSQELTATAGGTFAERPAVRARNAKGGAVADVEVEFVIEGDTRARFTGKGGDTTKVTVVTGEKGVATAPALAAGEDTGDFTIRATAAGRSLPPVEFSATVEAPRADNLSRVGDEDLTATPGAAFEQTLTVQATWQGAETSGVPVSAAMVTEDGEPAEEGPYFKAPKAPKADAAADAADAAAADDAEDEPVRELTGLKTGRDGLLELPELYADDATGTFWLELTTADGGKLTVELTVKPEPETETEPETEPETDAAS